MRYRVIETIKNSGVIWDAIEQRELRISEILDLLNATDAAGRCSVAVEDTNVEAE